MPIQVLIQLVFKRHIEAELKHSATASMKKTHTKQPHQNKNAIDLIPVVQTPQYNEQIQAR